MSTINLCQTSTGQEDDWKNLYEASFPQDERMSVCDLRKMMAAGTVLLHKTTNAAGELLCFSIVNPLSNFGLLGYIASDSTKRSSGVGSKHMKRLIEILKNQYPTYIGLFLEIESTKEPNLSAEDQKTRQRRLAFYQRLGCKRLCKKYLIPTYAQGAQPRLGELMWAEFNTPVAESSLPAVITELYQKAYNLPATDPIVQQVVGQFAGTASATVLCTTAADNSGNGSNSGAGTNTASGTTTSAATTAPAAPAADSKPATDSGTQTPAVVTQEPSAPAPTAVEPAKPADEATKAGDKK